MTQMRQCVEKLASEINARPAGTDEEQSAAIYIQEQFQSNTDLEVEMEEFQTSFLGEMLRSICAGVVFFAGLLAILFPAAIVASIVLALLGGILYLLDELSIFKLSSIFGKSPTQNVIAKYIPSTEGGVSKRSRKIVLITNYDSEKMRPEVSSFLFPHLGKVRIAELICVVIVFLILLFTLLLGQNLIFTLLLVIGCIGSVLPLISFIFHQTAQYNQGANNNAASIAVMLDVAKRISSGVFTPRGEAPVVHGQDIAHRAGVIPYDAEVEWDTPITAAQEVEFAQVEVSDETENLDGKTQIIEPVDNSESSHKSTIEVADEDISTSLPKSSGPDWFNRGKAKANGGEVPTVPTSGVRRSAFGDALQNANNRASNQITENKTDLTKNTENMSDLDKALAAIHDNIERASQNAAERAREDVQTAERVLENEISEIENKATRSDEQSNDVAEAIPVIAAEREPEITLRPAQEKRAGVTGLLETVTESPDYEATRQMEPLKVDESEEKASSSTKKYTRSPIDDRLAARSAAAAAHKPVETVKRDIQLPSLTGAIEAHRNEQQAKLEEEKEKNRIQARDEKLGITVPSLEDTFETEEARPKNTKVAQAGAFGVGEATGTFAPITDELVAGLSEEETYVLDADDTIYEEQATESGAVAGPGYVEIPETRTESVFGKIFNRKKKKTEKELSFREAYDVDEDFDAREVGKKRGDWKSFAQDDDEWNGGMAISSPTQDFDEEQATRDDIFAFAEQYINHEVWCVALGAECADHAGSKKFFEMHKDELKGSIFIVLDGLGAGVTTLVEKDGVLKPKQISPRMKRIARSAAKTAGIELDTATMTWTDSLASVVGNNGFSFIHVAGFEQGKPAMLLSKDDIADHIEDEVLQENANYVMEIMRSI